jgi:hypothetical protein
MNEALDIATSPVQIHQEVFVSVQVDDAEIIDHRTS